MAPFNSSTVQALASALDTAILRQQVIASNIANANTPGYGAQQVNFSTLYESEEHLAFQRSAPSVEPALDMNGQPLSVRLDQEVANMAQNNLHYQALLKGVSRHFSVLAAAVADNKR